MDLTGIGLYTIPEAARFSRATTEEIRRWLYGYARAGRHYEPLWYPQIGSSSAISFADLLELKLVMEFVRGGVRLNVVRASIEAARRLFGSDYPLTSHRFLSDGRRIFHEALEDSAEPMTDMAAQQRVINEVIRPSLHMGIEYTDGRASRWFPEGKKKTVVLDPQVGFGAPTLTGYGIRTETIAAALIAEKSAVRVAHLFNIAPHAVRAAAHFEKLYAA